MSCTVIENMCERKRRDKIIFQAISFDNIQLPIARIDYPRMYTQGHGDLGCVSLRWSVGRLVARSLETRSRVNAYAETEACTHRCGARAEAQSQLCTPTRTAFIHKSGETDAQTSCHAAPCLVPDRPFTNGVYVAPLDGT